MKSNTAKAIIFTSTTAVVSGFSPIAQHQNTNAVRGKTELYGLFDGVKDAFSQPPSSLDAERETPIDRWMGWSVVSENEVKQVATPVDFVDSMDEKNYVGVSLSKPMGIVFEENDTEYGGIFVQSVTEEGAAAKNGIVQPGDQLVVVGTKDASGLDFDDALAAIIECDGDTTSLSLFRGTAKQFYGPTGPSKQWLTTFSEKGGVAATPSPVASEEAPAE
mmetsp:Transcript_14368/g.33453  ORF Transcript_14368/g.33453 Transcript_14368/m.33453 type:complete len:219 (+) Transcript_14368:265-921(+)|eukprot:CAMPEP_0197183208 /NCGR_PEP_ID=MMETSP1423-20130617/7664_1 /TAXON_ID=476441 /ORGANISM="Pseudo-nitzschia heimii, Strain UNC1101" /LENGTH=218 /DNA_ID=CAMNT_0042633771 /DNA_START=240 /DNA_END=896 /DNA_ORIENTATION=+